LFIESAYEQGGERSNPFVSTPHAHGSENVAAIENTWQIEVRSPRWTFAAEWPLANEERASFIVEIECQVEGGDVAFSFAEPTDRLIGETTVHAGIGRQKVSLYKPEAAPIRGLLLRHVDAGSVTAQVRVFHIRCFDAVPTVPSVADILRPSVSTISV